MEYSDVALKCTLCDGTGSLLSLTELRSKCLAKSKNILNTNVNFHFLHFNSHSSSSSSYSQRSKAQLSSSCCVSAVGFASSSKVASACVCISVCAANASLCSFSELLNAIYRTKSHHVNFVVVVVDDFDRPRFVYIVPSVCKHVKASKYGSPKCNRTDFKALSKVYHHCKKQYPRAQRPETSLTFSDQPTHQPRRLPRSDDLSRVSSSLARAPTAAAAPKRQSNRAEPTKQKQRPTQHAGAHHSVPQPPTPHRGTTCRFLLYRRFPDTIRLTSAAFSQSKATPGTGFNAALGLETRLVQRNKNKILLKICAKEQRPTSVGCRKPGPGVMYMCWYGIGVMYVKRIHGHV